MIHISLAGGQFLLCTISLCNLCITESHCIYIFDCIAKLKKKTVQQSVHVGLLTSAGYMEEAAVNSFTGRISIAL